MPPGEPEAMEERSSEPGALLDALRVRVDWDDARRSSVLDELIARFAPEVLIAAILPRLSSIGGPDGEVLIGLVEGLGETPLLDALADALLGQPDLPPDRLWLALEALEGSGRIEERPGLAELREEMDDLLGGDDPLADLAGQIESDPESIPLAVAGLAQIEPEVRTEILRGLADGEPTPALRAFFEALAGDADATNRAIAREVFPALRGGEGTIAAEGPLVPAARGRAASRGRIGPLDGEGRATIAWRVEAEGRSRLALFRCDVRLGLVGAEWLPDEAAIEAHPAWAGTLRGGIEGADPAALRLVGASAWLSGAEIPEGAREMMAEILGESFVPGPIHADEPAGAGSEEEWDAVEDARSVLDQFPEWLDDSSLVRELAVEMAYLDPSEPPDPGPYRVLFEGRILGRIDLYRRMLLWSALVRDAQGRQAEAGAASRLAAQLGDPQNAVPGHPFLAEFMRRSVDRQRP